MVPVRHSLDVVPVAVGVVDGLTRSRDPKGPFFEKYHVLVTFYHRMKKVELLPYRDVSMSSTHAQTIVNKKRQQQHDKSIEIIL